MRQPLPPLNSLRAFEAAARHLSFKHAADELHVTPAAISQQVRSLEDYLGVTLFQRLNRAIVLTDEGISCLPELRQGFDKIASAVARLREDDARGFLVANVAPAFATMWLVPRLLRFQDQHPEITVRLETTTAVVDPARDGIDVAIRFGGDAEAGLHDEVLFGEEVIPVCAPSVASDLREPADLSAHTLIHLDGESADPTWPDWATWLHRAGVEHGGLDRGLRFTQTMTAAQAAKDGHGVALLGRRCLADDLAAGRLVQPLPLGVPTVFAYRLVATEAAAALPKVQAFRNWLRTEVDASLAHAADAP